MTKTGFKCHYTFGGEGYVHYLDGNDGFSQVIRIKTHCIAHFKYMLFIVCQLFLNKTFF